MYKKEGPLSKSQELLEKRKMASTVSLPLIIKYCYQKIKKTQKEIKK